MRKDNKNISLRNIIMALTIAIVCGMMTLLSACHDDAPVVKRESKNVIFLSSFHDSHEWTKNVWNAMRKRFDESKYDVKIYDIYLDVKNIPDKETQQAIFRTKIGSYHFKADAVIVSDLEATQCILEDTIVKDIPRVFVSEYEKEDYLEKPGIYGITAEVGYVETFKLATSMFPKARNIHVISDSTMTGEYFESMLRLKLRPYMGSYAFDFNMASVDDVELLDKVSRIKSGDIVILCTWQQGLNGVYYDPKTFYPKLADECKAPIFTLVNNALGHRIIGGYVLSPQNNGATAASEVVSLWEGRKVARHQVIKPIPVIDIDEAKSHNADMRAIPSNVTTLNDWDSYLHENKGWVLLLAVIVVVLISVIIVLVLMQRRIRSLYKKSQRLQQQTLGLLAESQLMSSSLASLKAFTWIYDIEHDVLKVIKGNPDLRDNATHFFSMEEYLEFVHPDYRKEHEAVVREAIESQTGEQFSISSKIDLDGDGNYEWWETRGLFIIRYDEDGNPYKCLSGINYNVETYKEVETDLSKMAKKAQEADRSKSAFLASMSHEIRTPLNAVIGFAEIIAEADDKDERMQYKNVIMSNAKMLLDLINDILDMSKIESGQMELSNSQFDFAELFHNTCVAFEARLNEGVKLVVEHPYEHCIVNLDKRRIQQIINNFGSNAVKYTPHGSITMGYDYHDGILQIYVKDTGIGISEKKRAKVFSRFRKLDNFAQGTGLGLSICKTIVEFMGGSIDFESEYGKGSTFWVQLPVQAATGNAGNIAETDKVVELAKSAADVSYKLLVAEDIDSNFMLLEAVIPNCRITRAEDGGKAVRLARQTHYDAILMDMRMPVKDGIEATKEIRLFDTRIPIIALTAFAYDADKEAAIAAGCDSFLTKPVDIALLLDTLSKLVRKPTMSE